MIHIQVHFCFIFSFNSYILKFKVTLNPIKYYISFFWKMNIKLWLKFSTYASWLQIVLDVFNFNIFF
jgi:hypothetical protein